MCFLQHPNRRLPLRPLSFLPLRSFKEWNLCKHKSSLLSMISSFHLSKNYFKKSQWPFRFQFHIWTPQLPHSSFQTAFSWRTDQQTTFLSTYPKQLLTNHPSGFLMFTLTPLSAVLPWPHWQMLLPWEFIRTMRSP